MLKPYRAGGILEAVASFLEAGYFPPRQALKAARQWAESKVPSERRYAGRISSQSAGSLRR
jgi:hypothetical protein